VCHSRTPAISLLACMLACTHTHTHTHGHSSGLNCLVGLPHPPAERWGGMRVGDGRLYFQGPHRPAASKRQQPDDKPAPSIYSTGRATPLRQPPHCLAGHNQHIHTRAHAITHSHALRACLHAALPYPCSERVGFDLPSTLHAWACLCAVPLPAVDRRSEHKR
jgi:hypothetical protein